MDGTVLPLSSCKHGHVTRADTNPSAYCAAFERELDLVHVTGRTPALGDQTLLCHIQVEEVERVVDGLDLAHLGQPDAHVLRGGDLETRKLKFS
jgi:hypothetical protein